MAERYTEEYFHELCNIVRVVEPPHDEYWSLLRYLFEHEFYWVRDVPKDENRVLRALRFREEFAYDICGDEHNAKFIMQALPESASILEVLVTIAIDCENQIMRNLDKGDRTSEWFWVMLQNLKLTKYSDSNWNKEKVIEILRIFMNREYTPNGRGGLFYVKNPLKDMRKVDIWYQLQWYCREHYFVNGDVLI